MNQDETSIPIDAAGHPELIQYRIEFPILGQTVYLNTCSLGALSVRSMKRLREFMEICNEWGGQSWYHGWLDEISKTREHFAKLIGAQVQEVALAPNVSTALSSLASALDYGKRNNVVIADIGFPTLAYQWLVKQRLGVESRFVANHDGVHTLPELFEQAVDSRTAIVAISRVCSASGYVQNAQNLRVIADIAHRNGAYVLIDDYQGTGQIPLEVKATGIDFLVTGSAKWLLGGPGLAFVYIREELLEDIKPTITGWFANRDQLQFHTREFVFRPEATRVESGTPAIPAIYTTNGGLDLIQEIGVERIRARTRFLANDLATRMMTRGWPVRMPEKADQRSAIVTLTLAHAEELAQALLERGIAIDARAGLLRIAPHFYNTVEENMIVVDSIAELLERR